MGSQMIQIIILAAIALFWCCDCGACSARATDSRSRRACPRPPRPSVESRPFEVIEGGGPDPDIADFIDPRVPPARRSWR
jgi:hypothetical protein